MRNPQYLVIYKDHSKAKQRFFGPFVNLTIAENFVADLPEPFESGHKLLKLTEPHIHSDVKYASMRLMSERQSLA